MSGRGGSDERRALLRQRRQTGAPAVSSPGRAASCVEAHVLHVEGLLDGRIGERRRRRHRCRRGMRLRAWREACRRLLQMGSTSRTSVESESFTPSERGSETVWRSYRGGEHVWSGASGRERPRTDVDVDGAKSSGGGCFGGETQPRGRQLHVHTAPSGDIFSHSAWSHPQAGSQGKQR